MAREFGIDKVIVPVGPGLFSTLGLLVADIEEQDVVSHRNRLAIDADEINDAFIAMEKRLLARDGRPWLCRQRRSRCRASPTSAMPASPSSCAFRCRTGRYGDAEIGAICERFESEHERTYGHRGAPGQAIEIVNLRLKAVHHRRPWNPFAGPIAESGGGSGRTLRLFRTGVRPSRYAGDRARSARGDSRPKGR